MSNYVGGCACGAVRYAVSSAPLNAFHCQCRQCQRATGTGHSSLLVMPRGALTVTGEVHYFEQAADDGSAVNRGFCPHCGSPLLGYTSSNPDIVLIAAASLDDPGLFQPGKVVFTQNAYDWDYMAPDLPRE